MKVTQEGGDGASFQSRVQQLRERLDAYLASSPGLGSRAKSKPNPPGFQKFHNAPPFDNKPDYPSWDKRGR